MFSRLFLTIILYITIVVAIFVLKPSMMFDLNGNMKHFDNVNKCDTSLLTVEIVLPFLALLCYFIILIFEMILGDN